MKLKVITKGRLGSYAGNGDKNMPRNGEIFIDTRPIPGELKKISKTGRWDHLGVTCVNCGNYSFITKEQTIAYLQFFGYTITKYVIIAEHNDRVSYYEV